MADLGEVAALGEEAEGARRVPKLVAGSELVVQRLGARRLQQVARLGRQVAALGQHLHRPVVGQQRRQPRPEAVVVELAHGERADRRVHQAHAHLRLAGAAHLRSPVASSSSQRS